MKNKYIDLVEQTFDWPAEEFELTENGTLAWNDLDLMPIVKQYGTPLRMTYLPKIDENIQRARRMFHVAMAKVDYDANYHYCYCTKSNHFSFVMERVLENEVHLETSSAFDINIVKKMKDAGRLKDEQFVVCNGYKTKAYLDNIANLINSGHSNTINVIDHVEELEELTSRLTAKAKVGIRIASEEEPKFEFYTSRLGIGYRDIVDFYKTKIAENDMAEEIISQIKTMCDFADVPEPNIFSEFGSFTVGESGANFYSILGAKQQNDRELWYMIDSSFMTTLPDSWAINKRFIMFPLNKWNRPYERVLLGGLTCDSDDYYNSEQHVNAIFLPRLRKMDPEPLIIGFFNTGAYQESLSGYGGTKHCLLPAPKHVVVNIEDDGTVSTRLFADQQSADQMLNTLGYE